MSKIDDDEKKPVTPAVEPDTDLQSYEEKGFTPEKKDDGNSDNKK
ncbi:MAG TPA: hypothetical protein PKG74_01615 [Candidatus Colwellbacteria bacterium]|nr:hypothetical protein [Candidatus Colwellbacteria bacterium]